ncbi:MAG: hypothetical protein R3325_02320, partial [Thermoanaerobaculia bacterium]|nr:hypothetical protein [Thermoanaerobaculia bacterium]
MSRAPSVGELAARLRREGLAEVELYRKQGRSRRYELSAQGRISGQTDERGWAVRAGGRPGSFFVAGTGSPALEGPWPAPCGPPLLLPSPAEVAPWSRPADLDAPLLGESEGFALLEAIERRLRDELPEARLLTATLEEGSSEAWLASARGVEGVRRPRAATRDREAAR